MTVIKGNAAEVYALAGVTSIATRGVDSVEGGEGPSPRVARDLALRERCIVAMTGALDIVSDGRTTIRLSNGHPLLGRITGSGCMTGSAIACFAASAHRPNGSDTGGCVEGDMLLATVAGISAINVRSSLSLPCGPNNRARRSRRKRPPRGTTCEGRIPSAPPSSTRSTLSNRRR